MHIMEVLTSFNMYYRISKKVTFSAAHHIDGHTTPDGLPGKCSRVHGHNYEVGVTFEALEVLSIGFIIDYYWVGQILKEIERRWDHTDLNNDQDLYYNDNLGLLNNPTAERISMISYHVISSQIKELIKQGNIQVPKGLCIHKVWCKETDGTEAEYFPEALGRLN